MNQIRPTIYVITYHEFNHGKSRPNFEKYPLDKRFLNSKNNYIYYLIDKKIPEELKDKNVIIEYELDSLIYEAGAKYFGEWSFLLAEEKHSFVQYPFYMVSSRFYEKNNWLYQSLDEEWNGIFSLLEEYGWAYLPSYDRPIRWIDLSWKKEVKNSAWKYKFFPFTQETFTLINKVFGLQIPEDYRYTADLFCNYIGFKTREHLLEYVKYYKPLITYFFSETYILQKDLTPFLRPTDTFRNEKTFTFLLEMLSHLFFYDKHKPYGSLHYDGYYEIREYEKKMHILNKFPIPVRTKLDRLIRWEKRKLCQEGILAPMIAQIRKLRNSK